MSLSCSKTVRMVPPHHEPGLRFLMPVVYGGGAQRNIGAPLDTSRMGGRRRHAACAARLAWAPAEPAPRSTRSAPLTADASHLNARNTLYIRDIQPARDLIDSMARQMKDERESVRRSSKPKARVNRCRRAREAEPCAGTWRSGQCWRCC
ncbi:hypothetical protein [Xanthomonas citri]|uniref:hypothetical protein n=1 Tax=Xanthomonas citri TaxID=346 RepID=UPI003CCEC7F8